MQPKNNINKSQWLSSGKTVEALNSQNLNSVIKENNLELTMIRAVLSTMCQISLFEICIVEAIRDKHGEIIDYNVRKVYETNNTVLIDPGQHFKKTLWYQEVLNQFKQQESKVGTYEFSTEDLNGKTRWFVNKQIVFKSTEAGLAQEVLVISQDITDKKSIELASVAKQHIIKSVTEASPDVLFILNLSDLALLYANKAVKDIFQYSPTEIVEMGGSFMEKHIHPEDKEKIINYFHSVATSKDFPLKELNFRMKDASGDWHNIRCRHSVYKMDENGLPLQLIGVRQDVTEYTKAQDQRLKSKLKQQQEISGAVLKTQEEERKRIAEVLHNSLGQVLYGARLNLSLLDPDKSNPHKNNEEIKERIGELLDNAITETKTISFELMPAILEDFGLEIAIKDLLSNKFKIIPIKYSVLFSGLKQRLNPDIEIAIFRIVQELINNLIKHSKANRAEIYINKGADYLAIRINDNGSGFNLESVNSREKTFGLRSITNRVKLLNGKINFDSTNADGSHITIDIPL
ncbi:MAG TPA: PAS domain-containing protein [Daejeonella sp.]|nr:PAS domain-containing protein [Daejeonella sp.]